MLKLKNALKQMPNLRFILIACGVILSATLYFEYFAPKWLRGSGCE